MMSQMTYSVNSSKGGGIIEGIITWVIKGGYSEFRLWLRWMILQVAETTNPEPKADLSSAAQAGPGLRFRV